MAAHPASPSLLVADSCFMSWARANDGWFQRLFPSVAAQLGMQPLPAVRGSSVEAKKES